MAKSRKIAFIGKVPRKRGYKPKIRKQIKITELGFEQGQHYYTMLVAKEKDHFEMWIGGLSGYFKLTGKQAKRLGCFLLDKQIRKKKVK